MSKGFAPVGYKKWIDSVREICYSSLASLNQKKEVYEWCVELQQFFQLGQVEHYEFWIC